MITLTNAELAQSARLATESAEHLPSTRRVNLEIHSEKIQENVFSQSFKWFGQADLAKHLAAISKDLNTP
jgi:hypothetical protein